MWARIRCKKRSSNISGDAAAVRWHLIGHLQRNKVKQLDHFTLFHALDRPALADAVSDFGLARGRAVDVLVQVNVAGEATKGGYEPTALEAESDRLKGLRGVRVMGVMTMAPFEARRCCGECSVVVEPRVTCS
jgi:uncharacterized pyridoxal phosphate-containing UPF0001 family protein